MKMWIALLKGVNVGGNNKLPMAQLRLLLESNGFHEVQTFIQSGNVIFQHQQSDRVNLAQSISEIIAARFGFKTSVVLLNIEELVAAIEQQPFSDLSIEKDAKVLHFFFFDAAPTNVSQTRLAASLHESERLQVVGSVAYFHTPNGFGKSKLGAKMESVFGAPCTARNWTTVDAILRLVAGESAN